MAASGSNSTVAVPTIAVVGGSFAGTSIIKKIDKTLKQQANIILIEERDHFHITFGALRSVTDPAVAPKVWVPYTKLFQNNPNSKVIHQKATAIHQDKITLQDGSEVKFDYLVIATGSKSAAPGKSLKLSKTEGLKEAQEIHEALKAAKSVAVIGGGVVGVELVGELTTDLPHLDVHLIHSGPKLLDTTPFLPDKFYTALADATSKIPKLTVHLDSKVTSAFDASQGYFLTPQTHTTSKGESITADITFFAIGVTPNSAIAKTLSESVVNEKNFIKTRKTGQLQDYDNIFTLGDVSDLDDFKLAYLASKVQGPLVADNIISLVKAKTSNAPAPKLKEYKALTASNAAMILPLGRNGGLTLLPFGVFHSFTTRTIKAKSLFLDSVWGDLNLAAEFPK